MRELICIVCPKGCHLKVDEKDNVTGNSCPRGKVYAINELYHPTRMVTSTVVVVDGIIARCPVMTSQAIPKDKIFAVMKEINKIKIKAPIKIRQVIIPNVLGLGADIVATREILKEEN